MNKILLSIYLLGWLMLIIEIAFINYMPIWYKEYSWIITCVFLVFIVINEFLMWRKNKKKK